MLLAVNGTAAIIANSTVIVSNITASAFNSTTAVNAMATAAAVNATLDIDPAKYDKMWADSVSGIAVLGTGATIMLLGNFVSLICMLNKTY